MKETLIDNLEELEGDFNASCSDAGILETPKTPKHRKPSRARSYLRGLILPAVTAISLIPANLNARLYDYDSRLSLRENPIETYESKQPSEQTFENLYPPNLILQKKTGKTEKTPLRTKLWHMAEYNGALTLGSYLWYKSSDGNDSISWAWRDIEAGWRREGLGGALENFLTPWEMQWQGSRERPGYTNPENHKLFWHALEGHVRTNNLLRKGYSEKEAFLWSMIGNYVWQSFIQSNEHPSIRKDMMPYLAISIFDALMYEKGKQWREDRGWKKPLGYIISPPLRLP